ncbi:hypothetical protein, partial [Providencia alcalifaciens]|uniref:hypothetical protein n=1 Tax=Providencia alcalifaciens TaxID=126385 RepID=UPI001E5640F6
LNPIGNLRFHAINQFLVGENVGFHKSASRARKLASKPVIWRMTEKQGFPCLFVSIPTHKIHQSIIVDRGLGFFDRFT